MRSFAVTLSFVAITAFGQLIAAQDPAYDPEITPAPTGPPENDFYTSLITPELPPDHDDYVDEADLARLMKRSPPAGVYLCTDKSWKGKCTWTPAQDNQCVAYPSDGSSSLGPPMGWQCKIFFAPNCKAGTGTDGKLTYPGTGDVGAMYSGQSGKPASYMCRMCSDAVNASPCINNNAPEWYFAQAKFGYGGDNGKCSSFVNGKVTNGACLPKATVAPGF